MERGRSGRHGENDEQRNDHGRFDGNQEAHEQHDAESRQRAYDEFDESDAVHGRAREQAREFDIRKAYARE